MRPSLLFAAVGLVACSKPPPPRPPPVHATLAQRTALLELEERARAEALQMDMARRAEVADVKELPGDSAPACPIGKAELFGDEADSLPSSATLRLKVLESLDIVKAPAPPTGDGPAQKAFAKLLAGIAARADGTFEPPDSVDRYVAGLKEQLIGAKRGFDLTLRIDDFKAPARSGEDGFVPGEIRGALLLWSRAQYRTLCAAPLVSDHSGEVTVHGGVLGDRPTGSDMDSRLFGDLFVSSVVTTVPRLKLIRQRGGR